MSSILTTLIDANTLATRLEEPGLRVVDCRFQLGAPAAGRAAYLRGHIPGAIYADLERDLSGAVGPSTGRHPLPERLALAGTLGMLGISSSQQVVAYDDAGGAFAARLWWLLRWLGHGAVAVLDGGLQAWQAGGRGLEAGEVTAPPQRFLAQASLVGTVTAEDILAGRVARLLDARAPERFRGEIEPIDPVAGHVPGAVNQPFSESLDGSGRFLGRELLRQRLARTVAAVDPSSTAVMCGSGVTACHLLLALEVAGLGGPVLYPGSWSEWIRDPSRGVATGDEHDAAGPAG